ncbi:nicotinamide riboside transporter PnuC [Acetobacter sp. LMG 32666]|uniref:nicotinamide riboside transporter PnuC n=1 Tax=Acetobacter sp. LMG 32666 TaxID=2959295 RepID=UPI0030C84F70
MNALEWVAALASALGVWLTGQRLVACWPVLVGASILYGVVFVRAALYADAALQGVFVVLSVYGWWQWLRGVRAEGHVRVALAPSAARLWWHMGGTGVAGMGLALALRQWTDDPTPMGDALLSAYSILAQFWGARRYRQSWLLWGVVDGLYTALFMERALWVTAVLYAAFVGLAVRGWQKWGAPATGCVRKK